MMPPQSPPPNYNSSDAEADGELPSPFDQRLFDESNSMKVQLDAVQSDKKGAFYRSSQYQEMLWDQEVKKKGPKGLDDWCAGVLIKLDEATSKIVRSIELSVFARTNRLAVIREQDVQVFNRPAPPILPNYELYSNMNVDDVIDDDDYKYQKAIKVLGGMDIVERSHFIDIFLQDRAYSNHAICCRRGQDHTLEAWMMDNLQSIRERGVPLWFLVEMQYFEATSLSFFGFATKTLKKAKKFLPRPKPPSEKIPESKIKTNKEFRECFLCSLMIMQKCWHKTRVFLPLTRTEFLFLSNPDSSFLKISRASEITPLCPLWDPPSDADDEDDAFSPSGRGSAMSVTGAGRGGGKKTLMMTAMMSLLMGKANGALSTAIRCQAFSSVSAIRTVYNNNAAELAVVFGPESLLSCGPCDATLSGLSLSSTSDKMSTLSYIANTEGAVCVESRGLKTCSGGDISINLGRIMEGRTCYYGQDDKRWIIILVGVILGLVLLAALAFGAWKYWRYRKNRKLYFPNAYKPEGGEGRDGAFARDDETLEERTFRETPLYATNEGNAFTR